MYSLKGRPGRWLEVFPAIVSEVTFFFFHLAAAYSRVERKNATGSLGNSYVSWNLLISNASTAMAKKKKYSYFVGSTSSGEEKTFFKARRIVDYRRVDELQNNNNELPNRASPQPFKAVGIVLNWYNRAAVLTCYTKIVSRMPRKPGLLKIPGFFDVGFCFLGEES